MTNLKDLDSISYVSHSKIEVDPMYLGQLYDQKF